MKIIGIYNGKNSGVTFIENNIVKFSAAEERFTRIKNDRGYPHESLKFLLKNFDLDKNENIEISIGSWKYPGKEIISSIIKNSNKNSFERIYQSLKTDFEYLNDFIINTKKIFPNSNIHFYDHHLSHFASSLFFGDIMNKRKDIYGIVADGRGSLKSLSIWKFKKDKIEEVISFPESHSFGAFYGSITYLLGFTPDKHEGKITGLAAYGKKSKLIKIFRDYIHFSNKKIIVNENFIPFIRPSKINYLKKITRGYSKEDIAYAAQYNLEYNMIKIINHFIPKKSYLIASGGIFANVKLNQRIRENTFIREFRVFPEMSDGGISFGSSLLHNYLINKKVPRIDNMFLGPEPGKSLIKNYLKKINVTKFSNLDQLANRVGDLIYKNKIIGVCNGNMEFGPRALGNRSIIFSPKNKDKIDEVNIRLGRNEFMPFAPVLIEKNAKKLFKNLGSEDVNLSFMTTCYNCKEYMINKFPAVVHVDKTARPQLISRRHPNKIYYKILEILEKKYGILCIVNTSFNTHDEPIVCFADHAINNLLKGSIDFLILNNELLERKS